MDAKPTWKKGDLLVSATPGSFPAVFIAECDTEVWRGEWYHCRGARLAVRADIDHLISIAAHAISRESGLLQRWLEMKPLVVAQEKRVTNA